MRLKSWASSLGLAVVALVAMGIVTGVRVQTQRPLIVFGSNSGVAQPIKATSNALWANITGVASLTSLTVGTSGIAANGVVTGANFQTSGPTGYYQVTTRSFWQSTADGLAQFLMNATSGGEEFNFGVPTLGTCTGGSMVSGSHNNAGQYTGNTSSSCVINFGAPNWTNAPFCWAMSTASTTHPRISAAANNTITVTGGVSGEAINFFCKGRIGT